MKYILALIILLVVSPAEAQGISQLSIYKRCYIQMTKMIPSSTDPLFLKVKQGEIKAATACLSLFDRAILGADGTLKNRSSDEAKNILKTFHDLHRSWFQSKSMPLQPATYLVNDSEEAPLYFTRAAFLPEAQFKSVVTLNSGLTGVRDQATYPDEEKDFIKQNLLKYDKTKPYANQTDLYVAYTHLDYEDLTIKGPQSIVLQNGSITEVGTLAGVKNTVPVIFPSHRPSTSGGKDYVPALMEIMKNFKANAHFGGGILGSQTFILHNMNLTVGKIPFEYTDINRRLTNRVFEDLLCHQMPTLEVADITSEIKPDSQHTFQQSVTCMQCHSGIDGMGLGYRNLFMFTSSAAERQQDAGMRLSGIAAFNPSSNAKLFATTLPEGRLHYRELITKTRKDTKFSSLQQLGEQISEGKDLYTCAAKRYYQFFTGVNVDLTAIATKPLDKRHQDQVIELGNYLKKNQSVRLLIYKILSSEAYQTPNYLTESSQ